MSPWQACLAVRYRVKQVNEAGMNYGLTSVLYSKFITRFMRQIYLTEVIWFHQRLSPFLWLNMVV